MTFVVHMLAHTPPYVFVLLAYLIWQGVLHPSCADVNADRVFMFHCEMMTPGSRRRYLGMGRLGRCIRDAVLLRDTAPDRCHALAGGRRGRDCAAITLLSNSRMERS
jgi:hypothetical protein